jgi:hypothetical protein
MSYYLSIIADICCISMVFNFLHILLKERKLRKDDRQYILEIKHEIHDKMADYYKGFIEILCDAALKNKETK